MSDFDLLKSTFNKIGLKFTIDYYKKRTCITIDEGSGYANFAASFNFDLDGKFTGHAVYE